MNISVKRLSVFLLALLMLLCAAACGKKLGTEDGSDVASGTNGDNATQTDPEGDGTPDLPENMNLDRTVNILVRSEFKDEFVPDDKTADVLSAAIFARNSAVSETLGVKLNFTDIACDEFTGPYGGIPVPCGNRQGDERRLGHLSDHCKFCVFFRVLHPTGVLPGAEHPGEQLS